MPMEVSMTTQIEAIYQNGIFKPLQEVQLPDNQRVRLSVQPIEAEDTRNWLEEVQQMRQRIIASAGTFLTVALKSPRTAGDEWNRRR
jgi:predicted DNA-binding antitoxin AbrB/MazE fold protein